MTVLERVMGPGMAAPETPGMRHLRIALIGMAALLGAGVLSIETVVHVFGPVATGAIFAGLLVGTLATGGVYFARKARRDDVWLDHLIAKGNEP